MKAIVEYVRECSVCPKQTIYVTPLRSTQYPLCAAAKRVEDPNSPPGYVGRLRVLPYHFRKADADWPVPILDPGIPDWCPLPDIKPMDQIIIEEQDGD